MLQSESDEIHTYRSQVSFKVSVVLHVQKIEGQRICRVCDQVVDPIRSPSVVKIIDRLFAV